MNEPLSLIVRDPMIGESFETFFLFGMMQVAVFQKEPYPVRPDMVIDPRQEEANAIQAAIESGAFVGITRTDSGIGDGRHSLADHDAFIDWVFDQFRQLGVDTSRLAYYCCPHSPRDPAQKCDCRPESGDGRILAVVENHGRPKRVRAGDDKKSVCTSMTRWGKANPDISVVTFQVVGPTELTSNEAFPADTALDEKRRFRSLSEAVEVLLYGGE